MPDGTSVGNVYLDLVVRDTLTKQLQTMAQQAQSAMQKRFDDMGKAAGDAMQSALNNASKAVGTTVNGTFSKSVALMQAKLKTLQKTLDDNTVRLEQMIEETRRGFTGSPWINEATEAALNANRAYQSLQRQQEKIEKQMEYLREKLAIEAQAAAAKQLAAEQAAYAKTARAAEEAAKRQQDAARQAHTTAAPPTAGKSINTENAVRSTFNVVAESAQVAAFSTQNIWLAALGKVANGFKGLLGTVLSVCKKISSTLWGITKSALGQLGNVFTGLAKSIVPFTANVKRAGNGVHGLATRLKSIVAGALIFNVISAGLRQMTSYIGTALTSTTQMQAALANLKGAAATAAAPIIQILTPALSALANAAATVFSYLSHLISFFTGKSVSAMASAAKGMAGVGSAAGGAAKEVKKANGELAAFDELNVLNKQDTESPDSSGGGGGVGAGDLNYDFQGKSPFLDSVLDAIKKSDWYQVGRLLGEKLRDSLNAIPWPDIQDKARQWAANLADTINGFVETPGLWEAVGHTLAQGMNTALYFLDDFVQKTHWESLGQGLGKGLNQMVSELDWPALGRVLSDKMKIVFETLYGFVQTFNFGNLGLGIASAINAAIGNIPWEQAGAGISGAVRGILNAFIIAVQNTDWATLGQSIATMIGNIDWVGIISDLSTLAVSILEAANELLDQVDWAAVGQTVADCLMAVDWGGILLNLLLFIGGILSGLFSTLSSIFGELASACGDGFLGGILSFFSDIASWIQTNMIDPLVSSVQELLGIHSPSTVFQEIGNNVVLGLLNGLSLAWTKISGFFSSAMPAIMKTVVDAWNWISTSTSSIWNSIGEIVRGAVNNIITIINNMIQAVVNGINAVIDIINSFSFDVPEFAQGVFGTDKFGFNIPKVTAPQIPLLANGGVITQPTLAMMGEYTGAGHNPEIAAPQSLLAETVNEAISPLVTALAELIEYLHDGGNQEIIIRFAASGGLEQLVRLLKPYIDKENNRRGGKLITGGVY